MFGVLKLSCHWIPFTNTVLEYFLEGGGGVNILYHNILTPPTQTLFELSTLILCQQSPVNGRNDKAKLSLDSALKLSFLYIIEGEGVNILYHNILTPPPPSHKKEMTTMDKYCL